jgi:sortase (surface protein transpeptidase)
VSNKASTAKNKQGQSAPRRLSFSRVVKHVSAVIGKAKALPAPKHTLSTTRQQLYRALGRDTLKRPAKPTKTAAARKTKKLTPKKPDNRQLIIRLSSTTKLVINIKFAGSPTKRTAAAANETASKFGRLNRQAATALTIILLGIAGTIYFGWHAVMAAPALPAPSVSSSTVKTVPTAKHYPKSQPSSISIPDIDVNTTISAVGNNPDGSMVVPANWHTAGWYQNSPTPGEIGPAIIDGHLDNVSGLAVFWRLRELTPGEFIYITRADGTTVQFQVNSIQNYSQADFPTKTVYGNINYAGLRLITCGGTFNRLTHEYDQNTVVYATLVN